MDAQIDRIREWAKGRARNASGSDATPGARSEKECL
jgi:hypothetical protein